MKNILLTARLVLLCIAFSLFTFSVLQAQSLSEKLGGVATQFSFSTKDSSMNVEQQLIIKRSVTETLIEIDEDYYSFAYGLGYEAYHLEFVSEKSIRYIMNTIVAKKRKHEFYYLVEFYDSEKKLIAEKKLGLDRIKKTLFNEKKNQYTYSMNLKDIPIILLDQTKSIDIIQYEVLSSKKKKTPFKDNMY